MQAGLMNGTDDHEKARWVRYGCEHAIECGEQAVTGVDVSVGGMRLRANGAFAVDQRLTLTRPNGDEPVEVECRVVWTGPSQGEVTEVGVAYVDTPSRVKKWVYSLIFA